MSCKLKVTEKKNTKNLMELLSMNKQTIEVGTVTNYGIKGGFNAFALSNVLDSGSSRGIPGWNYNQKAFDKFKAKAEKQFNKGIGKIIRGTWSISAMTNEIGIQASTDYKAMIEKIKTPPNSPATIKRKGFNNPMIDTGHFKSNIAARINGSRIVGRGG